MDLSGADLGSLVAEMDLTGELAASMVNLTVGAPPICPELDAATEMMDPRAGSFPRGDAEPRRRPGIGNC